MTKRQTPRADLTRYWRCGRARRRAKAQARGKRALVRRGRLCREQAGFALPPRLLLCAWTTLPSANDKGPGSPGPLLRRLKRSLTTATHRGEPVAQVGSDAVDD